MIRIYPPDYTIETDGSIVVWDENREKTLSVSRPILHFGIGHVGVSSGRWLNCSSGTPSGITGYYLSRTVIITAISFATKNIASGNIHIFSVEDGEYTFRYELNINSTKNTFFTGLDVDCGQSICAMADSGTYDYPSLLVEVAYVF